MSGPSTSRPTALEAAPLLHALCARAAEDVGVRALAIKGPIVAMQGLRAPRVSADIDVLVHPDDLRPFSEHLLRLGWHLAPQKTTPRLIPSHSLDLLHEHWPCGIDLHHYYPGFLADDRDVFETLWARRKSYGLAGLPVPALDPVAQTALVGLHLLRDDPLGRGSQFRDLSTRARDALSPDERRALVDLAEVTDALIPIAPLLDALGVAPSAPLARNPRRLQEWIDRSGAQANDTWAEHFRHLQWWRWPIAAWRAVMLPPEELRAYHSEQHADAPVWRLRMRRLVRGAKRLLPVMRRILDSRN